MKEEKHIYQLEREEEPKKVETFDNKTITVKEVTKKNTKLFPLIAGIVLLALSAIIMYYKLANNPKYIIAKSFDCWKNGIQKITKHIPKNEITFEKETTTVTETFNLKTTEEEFEEIAELLKQLSFQLDVRTDQKAQKQFLNIKGNKGDETFLDLTYLNDNNKQYILLKEVLEKYLELEQSNRITNQEQKEAAYVWDIIKQSFKNNLKSSYFKKENETILIDGKNIKTDKITFDLNQKNMSELFYNIVRRLKNDKRAKEFLTSLYKDFPNLELSIIEDTTPLFSYIVYVKKGSKDIVKISLQNNQNAFSYILGNTKFLELVFQNQVIATAYLEEKKDGFTLTINDANNMQNKITITKTVEEEKTKYQTDINLETIKINLLYQIETKDITKESYKLDSIFSINIQSLDQQIMTLEIIMNGNTSAKAEIEEVKNSISIKNLTEEEKEKIKAYFEHLKNVLGLES